MVYLGIDYGRVRIGLAIGVDFLACPLMVLTNEKGFFKKLFTICRSEDVEKIIVGLPEGGLVKEIKNFGLKVAKLTSLPVEFGLETLTTKEAIAKMVEVGKKKRVRKEKRDAFAAALILQKYLDKNV